MSEKEFRQTGIAPEDGEVQRGCLPVATAGGDRPPRATIQVRFQPKGNCLQITDSDAK
jgi:hypothetical protein